jgi:hypothetical protein
MRNHPQPAGTADALTSLMNASTQARVRHIFMREFYRRGRLTWDMKMALQHAFAGMYPLEAERPRSPRTPFR